jgi:glutathione S-transferase
MKLYYTPGACSLSPHIVAREAGLPVQLERVDLAARRTETGADFLKINPNGYVPAMRLPNDVVLTEGAAIVQYLADLAPQAGLLPPAGTLARAQVQAQLNYIATELHKLFSPLFRPDADEPSRRQARDTIARKLDYVESVFADGRLYFSGGRLTVADIYLFVVVGWCGPCGIDLSSWPKLGAFMAQVGARPKVQDALRAEGLLAAA